MSRYEQLDYTNEEPEKDKSLRKAILGGVAIGVAFSAFFNSVDTGAAAYNIKAGLTFNELNNAASGAASEILDQNVRVHCDDEITAEHDAVGLVASVRYGLPFTEGSSYTPPVMTVREEFCEDLAGLDLEANSDDITYNELFSVYIVQHEAEHINGTRDEAAADCYAVQKMPETLTSIGVSEDYASAATDYLARYLEEAPMPAEYRSPECSPGGELDLEITDDIRHFIYVDPELYPNL